jgi:hypothetical protein
VQRVRVFLCKICSLLARRRSSQPVQRVYWPKNVIDWLGKWRPTYVMRHARGQKLQSFRRNWPFYMDLYSMPMTRLDSSETADSTRVKQLERLRYPVSGLRVRVIYMRVTVNRGTTCNLRNPRYSGVRKPIREWELLLLKFAIDC